MRRTLKIAVLSLLLLITGTFLVVQVRSVDEPLPAPDLALPIHTESGAVLPLADVLAQARKPAPPASVAATPKLLQAGAAAPPDADKPTPEQLVEAAIARESPLFHMAELARRTERLDEALALYQSIPEADPEWALAQRRIAWDILTKARGEPRRAVSYAQAALRSQPLEGNSWQDLARVYGATLGFDVD